MAKNEEEEIAPPPMVRLDTPAAPSEDEGFDHELYAAHEQVKKLRGLFANRIYVAPDGKHLRISFGERIGDEDVFHTSIVMPLEEAYQSGELLLRMATSHLEQMWGNIRAAISEEAAQGEPEEMPGG